MAGWIEIHPERVAYQLTGLHWMLRCSERKNLRLDRVHIVNAQVQVELLRPLARRPCRRNELFSQLERQSQPVDHKDDPVIPGEGDFPADNALVELRECPRLRAIQDHRAHSGEGHGLRVFHGSVTHAGRPAAARSSGVAGVSPMWQQMTATVAASRRGTSELGVCGQGLRPGW